ncbi:MAG: ABC transporter permease [Rhodospirillales bacterium]|nr:ABC transporter permease [Rhodospirillales bacterium]
MTPADHITTAFGALRANKLRSILTTLGVIIGVASVIVMAAVGSGAQKRVEDLIKSIGTNLLNISPGSSRLGGRHSGANTALPFSDADVAALLGGIPEATGVTGLVGTNATAVNGNANWVTSISGVQESFPDIQDWPIVEGRFFAAAEVHARAKVAVLGASVARQLFGGASPVGQQIRINKVPFRVIGVFLERGQTPFGHDRDDLIAVPITTARSRLVGRGVTVPNEVQRILFKIDDGADLTDVQNRVTALLRARRHLAPGAEDNFSVRNYAEIIQARTATQRTLGWLLGATAAVSLIVGGIGIMNIMLVSVTERTREIGLRIAVGARPRDIMIQFLMESVALCLMGGVIGLMIGLVGAAFAAMIADWPIIIGSGIVFVALMSSVVVGVIFGYVPARRAARLNPIEALRHE